HIADHQRRRLERGGAACVARARAVAARLELAGVVRPRAREPRHVAAVDLRERREAHPARVVAVAAPLAVDARGRRGRHHRAWACGEREEEREGRGATHWVNTTRGREPVKSACPPSHAPASSGPAATTSSIRPFDADTLPIRIIPVIRIVAGTTSTRDVT